jgi:chaperonin GroEL (HSP60 family)
MFSPMPSRSRCPPCGGTALLYASKALNGLKGENDGQTRGIDIVRKALQAPLRQIAENAGHDGGVVAGRLLDGNDENLGFNAQSEQYENLSNPALSIRPRWCAAASRTRRRSPGC